VVAVETCSGDVFGRVAEVIGSMTVRVNDFDAQKKLLVEIAESSDTGARLGRDGGARLWAFRPRPEQP
jgi:hypothetical protein